MAESENCVSTVIINGETRKIKDQNAVTKAEFEKAVGDINSIIDNINGTEV